MIDQTSPTSILQQLLYFTLKLVVASVQKVLHHINGVASHRSRLKRREETQGLVAEVSTIIARIPNAGMSIVNGSHFCCWHHSFVTADYILKRNVFLYYIDCEQAVFIECPETVNLYDTRKHPFFFIAQRENAVKTIRIPLVEFLNLAKRIGDPKCKVGWVFHTARCGSTALAQGLNAIPNCTVISESQDMLVHLSTVQANLGVTFDDYIHSKPFYDLLSAAIIFILKNYGQGQQVCIKTTASFNYLLLPLIIQRFPDHRFVSMHRHGAAAAKSFWRITGDHVGVNVGLSLAKCFPNTIRRLVDDSIFIFTNGMFAEVKEYYEKNLDLFMVFYIMWVTNIVTLLKNAQHLSDGQVLPVFYDDLQADKRSQMLKVLNHLEIDAEYIDVALDAMMADSQAGSPFGLEVLENKKNWVRDEQTVAVCNRILAQFNLPNFDQKFRFNKRFELELIY